MQKPKDNLYPEGEFERPSPDKIGPGGRAPIVKHPDNLKLEGEFERPTTPLSPNRGDRALVKKPQDNLYIDGSFDGYSTSKTQYKEFRGERAEIKRHTDTLTVGTGTMETKSTSREAPQGIKEITISNKGELSLLFHL